MKVESGSSFKASTSVEASNPEKERGGGGGAGFLGKGKVRQDSTLILEVTLFFCC